MGKSGSVRGSYNSINNDSQSNENTSLQIYYEGLDHNEKSDIQGSSFEAVDAFLKSINSKTKNGGKELFFSLESYNTHSEIMAILEQSGYKIYAVANLFDQYLSEQIYKKLIEVKFYLKQLEEANDEEQEFLESNKVFSQLMTI